MAGLYLVGTDGSECATRAAQFAAAQAKEQGAELLLVAVVEWSRYTMYTPEELETRQRDKQKEIEAIERTILEPLEATLEPEAKVLVRHGHPAEVLSSLAKERGADQVFIGRHGRSRMGIAIFGSVTSRLLQLTTVPVTVVP